MPGLFTASISPVLVRAYSQGRVPASFIHTFTIINSASIADTFAILPGVDPKPLPA